MSSEPEAVQVGEWRVEQEFDLIARNGRAVKVEPRAMRVLSCLIARAGHVVTVEELLERAWPDAVVGPDSVYQAVGLLRRTLGDDRHHPAYIEHVPRKGYRLIAPVGAPAGTVADAGAANNAAVARSSGNGSAGNGTTTHGSPTSGAATADAPQVPHARPGNRIVWAVLAVAIATLGVAYFLVRSAVHAPPVSAVPVATANIRAVPSAASAPSIAVLPFLDLSENQDLGYFADGLSEELIDLLSRASDLRVPARTSSFYFKGRTTTVADMARALNVDNLLEGSVRRSGNRVRVTAQLIRADSGYHLWSQTYDRELNEIFAVEDDIAATVASTLQSKLAPEHPSRAAGLSGAAGNLRSQCEFFIERNTRIDAGKAVECYRKLVALAPQAASAWAGYADAIWRQPFLAAAPIAELRRGAATARLTAQHALALDPANGTAHAVLAVYHRVIDRDWSAAEVESRAALASDPADPAGILAAAMLARALGQFRRAIELCEQARARDPLNFLPYARLGALYLYLGRLPEAEAAVRRRLDISPEGAGGRAQLAEVLMYRGQLQAALATARAETNEETRLTTLALIYHALGRDSDSDAALAQLSRGYGNRYLVHIAEIHAYRGENDEALTSLEQALASGEPTLPMIKSDVYFAALHGEPRYRVLLGRLNLPERDPG